METLLAVPHKITSNPRTQSQPRKYSRNLGLKLLDDSCPGLCSATLGTTPGNGATHNGLSPSLSISNNRDN